MPDIAMCKDNQCPAKSECYRHKASGTVPTERMQAYSGFAHNPEKGRCNSFVQSRRKEAHEV